MTNATAIPNNRPGADFYDRRAEIDRALRRLTSKLLPEGTLEEVRARMHFQSNRDRKKFKRGRKTGPKNFNKSGPWKLHGEAQ